MKNLDNVLELIVAAKTIKGTSFIAVNGYTNKQGEVSNQTIVGGISYENALLNDFQTIQDNLLEILDNETLNKTYGSVIVEQAYFEIMESLEKRLSSPEVKEKLRQENDSTINRSDAQNDAYIYITKGVKLHKESQEIHIYGLVVRKKVLVPIEYKTVNSKPLTLCKNAIQKHLNFKQSKYRNFIFNQADVKIKGIEIKN